MKFSVYVCLCVCAYVCTCVCVRVCECVCMCVCVAKFVSAPHTLQEGHAYYAFEEQKLVDFTTCSNAGIISIQEPQCLHCIAMGEESIAQYNAISFCKYTESGRILNFRVQFMCNSAEWNEVRITVLLRCS